MDSPIAQGTDGQPTGQTTQTGQPNEGFQRRIDELTAEKHQANARLAQLEDTLTQQAMQMAQLTATLTAGSRTAEPTEVDPEIGKQVSAVVDPMMKRIEATLGQLAGKLTANEAREVEQVIGDPAVVQQAKNLQSAYARNGVNANLETCVDQVLGQKLRAEKLKAAGVDAARRAGNSNYHVLSGGGAPATGAPVPGGDGAHPASKFTPEYLNKVGEPGGPTAKQLDAEMARMADLPLRNVVR